MNERGFSAEIRVVCCLQLCEVMPHLVCHHFYLIIFCLELLLEIKKSKLFLLAFILGYKDLKIKICVFSQPQ